MGRQTIRLDSRVARLGICLVMFALLFPRPARASSTSAYAVIEAVNALRAAKGLAAYQVDGELMAYAQGHAEYEASIHTSTHTHQDGNQPWAFGVLENIAEGDLGYLTPDFAVNVIWQDAIHLGPMIDYQSGYVGAGVANDGETEYYTLNIRPGASTGKAVKTLKPGQTPSAAVTLPPIVPLKETATPRPDGGVLHKVGYGQTLWTIAQLYGIKIDELRRLNNMEADDNDIYSGQKLWIRWPLPQTPTPLKQAAVNTQASTVTLTLQAGLRLGEIIAETVTAAPSLTVTESEAISYQRDTPTARQAAPDTLATQARPTPGAAVEFQPLAMSPLVAGLLILAGAGILGVLAITLIRKG